MSPDEARKKLAQVVHPELGRDLVSLEMIGEITADLKISVDLLTYGHPRQAEVLEAIRQAVPGASLQVGMQQRSTQPPLGAPVLGSVKNVVAVASGKGGVGKSTVASNLAASLALEGARVGLMDADIYGPSIPALLGLENSPLRIQDKRICPVEKFGLKIMSMGFLMRPGESVIWRGPMLHGMINQFCKDVDWGELDFMIIDLPPGTGDVSLSLAQLVPLGGAVLVSTPQDVALGVATKAVNMFRKLNVPLIGMVENMSFYACPHCGQRDDLFGHGGARQAADEMSVPFLGEVPLNSSVREAGDKGEPVVISAPESAPAQAFRTATRSLAGKLAMAAVLGYEAVIGELSPSPSAG